MKKLIALLLALVMVLGLVACASKTTDETPKTDDSAAAPADTETTDNTAELVKVWQAEETEFEIRYLYKENGGMHTAHNAAYANIDTELNVCIDSDDALADGAVRCIVDLWEKTDRRKYAGIIGLDADMNTGKVIGTGFPEDMKETTLAGFYDAGGSGDKKLVYRTDIMKELPPYPVFDGEI